MFYFLPRSLRLLPRLFLGLAFLLLLLPACKTAQTSTPNNNYLLDIAKAITKTNLQRLFPDAHFERDSVQAGKTFEQAFLRKVFHEKVRHFLTPSGHLEASTQDFQARIAWERVGEQVRISLIYYKKQKNLQGSCILPAKRARDGLLRYV